LLAVVLILSLLLVMAMSLATAVVMDTRSRGAFSRVTTGFYAAESGVNHGIGRYRNMFLRFHVPTGSDFAPHTLTLGERSVSYQLGEMPGNPQQVTIPAGELFGGLNSIRYVYSVKSAAEARGATEAIVGAQFDVDYVPLFQFVAFYEDDLEILPGPTMRLHGRVHTNGNLYLDSNTGLFVEDNQAPAVPAADRITTVQVSARGDLFRGRKDVSECRGGVTVDMLEDLVPGSPDLDPRALACGTGTRRVPPGELAAWKGSIVSGVGSIAVPEPDLYAKGTGQFWTNADLRIVLRLGVADQLPGGPALPDTIEVQTAAGGRDGGRTAALHQFMADAAWNAANGSVRGTMPVFYTDVPTGTAGCTCTNAVATGCNNAAALCYAPAFAANGRVYATTMGPGVGAFDGDYRRGGFYNWRERKWMRLLNVNVHDLLRWAIDHPGSGLLDAGDVTDGGLVVFLSVEGPASGAVNNYGVRLFGSRQLPFPAGDGDPTGITVVSDQAVYVTGDYNAAAPKQPAAVVGDSLNVLSNAYFSTDAGYTCGATFANDCQSNRSLTDGARRGSSTAVQAAFLAGVDRTALGQYNGGLENYPRFHEDWTGATLTYRGSFVSLGRPQHAAGSWCGTGGSSAGGCNIYSPPARNWDYDPSFNDARNLPPLTPRFVSVQQVLFSQDFR